MARGGKRPGSGRPKGAKSPQTLERERIQAALRQRAMRHVDILFDSQLTLARGQTYLFKIEKEKIGTGKNARYINKKPELVTAQQEIEDYLAGVAEGDVDDASNPDTVYYFLTTKDPNNQAIDSILDRTFGKATQPVKPVGDNDEALPITSINVVPVQAPEQAA